MKSPFGPSASPAIKFDPLLRASSPDLKLASSRLAVHLEDREKAVGLPLRSRSDDDRSKFRAAVESLACNLLRLALCSPAVLAVPKSSGMMWAKGRYQLEVYGAHFLDALAVMAHPDVALIENVAKGYSYPRGDPQGSTIRPTDRLRQHVAGTLNGWHAFTRLDSPEVLVLKGVKDAKGRAEMIDYRDTDNTRARRKEVQTINRHLRAAPIFLAPGAGLVADTGQAIDPSHRTIRRIFNNANWREGGRLFDGFWEGMSRRDRSNFLRIGTPAYPDGEPIANVDFGQLFLRLAYVRAGITPPDGDLYDMGGGAATRPGWKRVTNALLFATPAHPLVHWPFNTSKLFPAGTKLREVVGIIKARHQPIAHLFETGIGYSFMFTESQILVYVLLALFAQNITALPLHDSVLVAGSHRDTAKAVMEEAFRLHTNIPRAAISIEYLAENLGFWP
jgi:hypothetical protein